VEGDGGGVGGVGVEVPLAGGAAVGELASLVGHRQAGAGRVRTSTPGPRLAAMSAGDSVRLARWSELRCLGLPGVEGAQLPVELVDPAERGGGGAVGEQPWVGVRV
jgi:hypothetical protein